MLARGCTEWGWVSGCVTCCFVLLARDCTEWEWVSGCVTCCFVLLARECTEWGVGIGLCNVLFRSVGQGVY